MLRKLLPSAPTATDNMLSSKPWRKRSPAKDARLPNERSVPSLRSVKQSELLGRRNVDRKERREKRNVQKNVSSVTASGGIVLEIGRENVATETGIVAATETGQKSAGIETETVIAIAEKESGQETAHEVARGITQKTDTGGDGVSEITAMAVQKRSRSNFPRMSSLAWKRRHWLIYYATASVSPPSNLSLRLMKS